MTDAKYGHRSIQKLIRWNLLERAALAVSGGDPTLQGSRDVLFRSFAKAVVRMGFNADLLSVVGLAFAIFASLLISEPLLAGALLALSLFFDGLDGVVARLTGTANVRGEILDVFCDTVGTLFIMAGLVFANYLSSACFIFYSVVLVTYTIISATKSNLLIGKYRSIGSRVVVTSYVTVYLVVNQFLPNEALHFIIVSYGVLFVAMILLFNIAWDLIGVLIHTGDTLSDQS
jgi:phosphatidylglycerophosphate synthase